MTQYFQINKRSRLNDNTSRFLTVLCLFTLSGSAAGLLCLRIFGAEQCSLIGMYAVPLAAALMLFNTLLGLSLAGKLFIPLGCAGIGALVTICSASLRLSGGHELSAVILCVIIAPLYLAGAQEGMRFSHALSAHTAMNSALVHKRNSFLLLSCLWLLSFALLYLMKRYNRFFN